MAAERADCSAKCSLYTAHLHAPLYTNITEVSGMARRMTMVENEIPHSPPPHPSPPHPSPLHPTRTRHRYTDAS